MMKTATRIVAVCDSTKFGRRSLALIAPLKAIHTVITDDRLSNENAETLTSLGIEVIRA
jgi:DeoR family transcriptional regulator of aga operon